MKTGEQFLIEQLTKELMEAKKNILVETFMSHIRKLVTSEEFQDYTISFKITGRKIAQGIEVQNIRGEND